MATDGEDYLGLQTTNLKKYWVKRFQKCAKHDVARLTMRNVIVSIFGYILPP